MDFLCSSDELEEELNALLVATVFIPMGELLTAHAALQKTHIVVPELWNFEENHKATHISLSS